MFYKFPVIKNINEILPHIDDNFRVYEKDGYFVVNYIFSGNETFPAVNCSRAGTLSLSDPQITLNVPEQEQAAVIRRECRGLIFAKDGRLLRRAYHKFFNHGEREETLDMNIDWSVSHVFLEKLDGSMVTPFEIEGYIRWATRGGITDVSMQAEVFVAEHPWYQNFAIKMLKEGYIPIFEWCSRKNRIVIDYPEDRLVLTALRNQETGEYLPYFKEGSHSLKPTALHFNIDFVDMMEPPEYLDLIDELENQEGVVIRFDNGHMLKVKSLAYIQIHRAKESLLHEKRILEMIIQERLDDVLPHLLEADREMLLKYQENFKTGYQKVAQEVKAIRDNWNLDRKSFALDNSCSEPYKSIIFSCWNNSENIPQEILNRIAKNLGSQTNVDKIRSLWDNRASWNYRGDTE